MSKFLISKNNKFYKRALKREIGIWKRSTPGNLLEEKITDIDFNFEEKNYHLTKNKDWINFVKKFGPFNKAIVLGGGNTDLEEYLTKNNIVKEIENLDIIVNTENNNKTNTFNDLNFVELPSGEYDLIIAKSILHHIINLEHLLLQVNNALTKNGLFVVFEYIGENKQQWERHKIKIINDYLDISDIIPNYSFKKSNHNYYNDWPFESIRSQDIPELLTKVFVKELEIKWGALRWPIIYHIGSVENIKLKGKEKTEIESRASIVENKFQGDGSLKQSNLFGIYKKTNQNVSSPVEPWAKDKIKHELRLKGPLRVRYKSIITTNINNPIIQILIKSKSFIKQIFKNV